MTGPGYEQEAPKGYEFTGEFRVPEEGESFCIPGENHWRYSQGTVKHRRLILRKIENVVQVNVFGYDEAYAYRVPESATLSVGDVVEVPFGYANSPYVGVIISHGRQGYAGRLKTVNARYARITL